MWFFPFQAFIFSVWNRYKYQEESLACQAKEKSVSAEHSGDELRTANGDLLSFLNAIYFVPVYAEYLQYGMHTVHDISDSISLHDTNVRRTLRRNRKM